MINKRYSEDTYILKSELSPSEIVSSVSQNTLIKKSLTAEFTNKKFIGRVESDSFSIFDSAPFPSGVGCIIHGKIKETSEISLTTTLHKGFRILFLVWALVMSTLFIAFWFIDPSRIDLLAFFIFMPVAILFFRIVLHGYYVFARNRALRKLKALLIVRD